MVKLVEFEGLEAIPNSAHSFLGRSFLERESGGIGTVFENYLAAEFEREKRKLTIDPRSN